MGESPKSNPTVSTGLDWDTQYALAKMMLIHYNLMHPFFDMQMKYYVFGCCNITLNGTIKMLADSQTVTYELQTEKFYKKEKTKLVKRKKPAPMNAQKYKSECDQAKLNLTSWTKSLLWGDSTSVKVFIDGREQE